MAIRPFQAMNLQVMQFQPERFSFRTTLPPNNAVEGKVADWQGLVATANRVNERTRGGGSTLDTSHRRKMEHATFVGMNTKLHNRHSRVNARISARLKRRLRQASTAQDRTMTDFIAEALEMSLATMPEKTIPKGRTWVDDLFGSAKFTDADMANDERLERLVKGARTRRED